MGEAFTPIPSSYEAILALCREGDPLLIDDQHELVLEGEEKGLVLLGEQTDWSAPDLRIELCGDGSAALYARDPATTPEDEVMFGQQWVLQRTFDVWEQLKTWAYEL